MKKLTGTSKSCVFGVLLLLLIVAMTATGCGIFNLASGQPSEPPTERPVDEMRFTAKTFAQQIALSRVYSLEVRVCEGKVYLNDILYEKVEKVSDPEITFAEDIIGLSDVYISEEVSEVLEKMKNSDSCYILETESNSSLGIKIAVYEIDGNYYFATAYDGVVERIHVAILEQ